VGAVVARFVFLGHTVCLSRKCIKTVADPGKSPIYSRNSPLKKPDLFWVLTRVCLDAGLAPRALKHTHTDVCVCARARVYVCVHA